LPLIDPNTYQSLHTVVKRFPTLIILPEFRLFPAVFLLQDNQKPAKNMKTASQKTIRISYSIGSGTRTIANRILQASVMVTKYSYWFLSVIIFFSCQKNLTQNDASTKIISQKVETPEEKSIVINAEFLSGYSSSLSLSDSSASRKIRSKVSRFYQGNAFKTKWMETNSPGLMYYALIDHLKNAPHYGLNAEAYNIDQMEQLVSSVYKNKLASSNDIANADIQLTETFFLFATHLSEGRMIERGDRGKIWMAQHRDADKVEVALLASAKNSSGLKDVIKKLQPAHEQYTKLQTLLVHYRALETSNVVLNVSARESIKPESKHAAIPAIRKKLSLMNIQTNAEESSIESLTDSMFYDNALVLAVKAFQQRHGLAQDGIIGGKTLTYLNQSFKAKADLIALNMERMRWLPETNAAQCIRVNIPEYKLRIYEQGKVTLDMDVIVGAVSSATPVFIDTLEQAVFSPTWTVPPSLVKEEFLPRLKRNPTYYANRKDFTFYKSGVEIDPSSVRWDSALNIHQYRIVQKPGANNALGLAKFIMPNGMNIYLHDTPDHTLFSQSYRAFSHGCIRLSDPAKFAAYLLQEEAAWNLANIKKAMISGNPTKIPLRKKYQVQLEYNTVWVDDNGNLNFREDIYGHDKRQLQRLSMVSSAVNLVAVR
jgi:L,D-transpeptidase YcbB